MGKSQLKNPIAGEEVPAASSAGSSSQSFGEIPTNIGDPQSVLPPLRNEPAPQSVDARESAPQSQTVV